jgi:NADH-ubiquinone oxidoreductase chain 5
LRGRTTWRGGIRGLCLLVAMAAKRAQLPLRAWLPLAMAAPTPISALVHSSTLVAAGVILLFKFSLVSENTTLLLTTRATLSVASLSAIRETDMKKVVALRTMRQMALMRMTLALGLHRLAFLHLATHAIFKRLMFISVGDIMHHSQRAQHKNLLRRGRASSTTTLQVSCLALTGLGFTSGFVRKDLIVEKLEGVRRILLLFSNVFSIGLTLLYSTRLLLPLPSLLKKKRMFNPSPIPLFIFCLILGHTLNSSVLREEARRRTKTTRLLFILIASTLLLNSTPPQLFFL